MTAAQVLVEIMREQILFINITFYEGTNHYADKCFKGIKGDKEKACSTSDLEKQQTERTP